MSIGDGASVVATLSPKPSAKPRRGSLRPLEASSFYCFASIHSALVGVFAAEEISCTIAVSLPLCRSSFLLLGGYFCVRLKRQAPLGARQLPKQTNCILLNLPWFAAAPIDRTSSANRARRTKAMCVKHIYKPSGAPPLLQDKWKVLRGADCAPQTQTGIAEKQPTRSHPANAVAIQKNSPCLCTFRSTSFKAAAYYGCSFGSSSLSSSLPLLLPLERTDTTGLCPLELDCWRTASTRCSASKGGMVVAALCIQEQKGNKASYSP